ncbi:1-phosphofructokinase family hexose kinase [Thermoactinomyces daqus]|uniref:Tagatose-6-phosphate kinase n=1 Tax=Thermoactinomyces daqus TaxID=1329516 RepID=A0A7W2AIH6_9BACL|nr:1-phosphofructokinase family hexose kinase [Thermoactinomyces daqus]MBA4543781.1 1-phosphofructokinase family hexose kinase [Thermoactinomyces daqus]
MIRIVCPNPALDRTILLPELCYDEVNRATDFRVVPGGKGLNVARACRHFQMAVAIYGFVGGMAGELVQEGCRMPGIFNRLTKIKGETRICSIFVEQKNGRVTVVNEPGPEVSGEEQSDLKQKLYSDIREGDIVIFSGSLPGGVSSSFYAELARQLTEKSVKIIVDTSGKALQEAMRVNPWFVKPNLEEFQELTGVAENADLRTILQEMKNWINQGVKHMVVTLGKEGLLYAGQTECFFLKSPRVAAVNPIACGDTLLGGFVSRYVQTKRIRPSLQLGVACAAANAMNPYPGIPDDADLNALTGLVEAEEMD